MSIGIPEIMILAALAVLFGVPLALLLWFAAQSIQMRALRRHIVELQARVETLERSEPRGPATPVPPRAAHPPTPSGTPSPEADDTSAPSGPAEPEPADRLLEPRDEPDHPEDHGTSYRPTGPDVPSGRAWDDDQESPTPVDNTDTDRGTGGLTR